MKVIIFGASGVGTTTLAGSLAQELNWVHLDVDDYYWARTEIPFEVKVPLEIRDERLRRDVERHKHVLVSGSLVSWGEYWQQVFDLGLFLRLPKHIRMERLQKREVERYGTQLTTDEKMRRKHQEFMNWAAQYDDESFEGRSIGQHRNWIKTVHYEVIAIEGDLTHHARMKIALEKISHHRP